MALKSGCYSIFKKNAHLCYDYIKIEAMEIIENTGLSWEEIKIQHPDEWVVLGDPIFDGMQIVKGTVLAHHPDKRVACMEGGERREGFVKFTLAFTGQLKSNYYIGLLRRGKSPLQGIPVEGV